MSVGTQVEQDVRDWPLWWFSALEAAVERGDFVRAAEAQRELARLGVRVNYGRPRAERSTDAVDHREGPTDAP